MKSSTAIRMVLAAVIVAAAVFGYIYRDSLSREGVQAFIEGFGVWAPLVFMAVYMAATVLFLPGSVFTLAGGALFGVWEGTAYSLGGATVGATLAFLLARYVAADWVAEKAGGRLRRIIDGVEQEGWRFVAFTRLVPVFPFNLLNYALGLTRIPAIQYVLASLVCMAPGAFAYAYLGDALAQVARGVAAERAAQDLRGTIQNIFIALGVFAAVMFLPRLVKRLRGRPIPGEEQESGP
jgi:uncharacterized membrane protein YdjX (TVP38/TMEM64 family)